MRVGVAIFLTDRAAGATSTLERSAEVALVAQRDPIVLAKAVASLPLRAGRRITAGERAMHEGLVEEPR